MRKLLPTALAILGAAVLASCGEQQPSDVFAPSLDKDTKCSIKVVGDYSNFEALENEFDRFNEYYPNVSLTYEKLDDYKNTLGTVLSGNSKPNIFFSYTWMNGDAKYAPVLSHMEELSDASLKLKLDCIRPGLISRDASGKVYMVPVFSRTYGTMVNNDLFKKEGLAIPTTWDELLNVSKTFAERGYKNPMMGFSKSSSSCLMNTVAYPMFVAELAKDPAALKLANDLDPAAGKYMRGALEAVDQLVKKKVVDLTECDKISDNYNQVILRFFEGDVPMMIAQGDTVSGTKKRESQSAAFKESPFEYSFHPIPVTAQGGYFIDSPSVEFSVNKDCENLDMTNEFMRFLIRNTELNEMATAKRLVTPTKAMSFDPVYAPFGKVAAERTFSPEVLGVKDTLSTQIRNASFKVGKGQITIEDAIANYGNIK